MFDPVQAQDDLTGLLLGSEQLTTVNIKSYRRMIISKEMDYRTLLTTARGGKSGTGVLVVQPTARSGRPNVSGPVLDWTFPILCLEDPVAAWATNGSQLTAEEIGQRVLNSIHLYADEFLGTFKMEDALAPEKQFTFPGIIGYRASFTIQGKSLQTQRVSQLTVSISSGLATITTATAGAAIQYTLDETYPTRNSSDNSSSQTYSAPFSVSSGDVIRAVAYASGLNNSAAAYRVAP